MNPARLHAVLLNGGGPKEQNFQSHLLHLQHLARMLEAAGVARERITIFCSDGDDPEGDVAVREPQPLRDFWRLAGTRVEGALRNPLRFANSSVPGFSLQPATPDALEAWFAGEGKKLAPGDTLLLFVTDHGTKNPEDLRNNHITMWGRDSRLGVEDLRRGLGQLAPGVRVLTLMSQCYSGSFAGLMYPSAETTEPSGQVCGYFSSTAERPAYGCYAENRRRNNVGHAFHFLSALGEHGHFSRAHEEVLVRDATPDVPLRTSDEYLSDLVRRAAGDDPEASRALAEELLREAWKDKARWESEIRLLDRIAAAYGIFSPRSFSEIDEQTRLLPDISGQMKATSRAWNGALADANEGNFGRFLAARFDWGKRLTPAALKDIDDAVRLATNRELLADLAAFTAATPDTDRKLRRLRRSARGADASSYRMETRLGVILRIRKILTSVAGRQYLAERGSDAERAAYEALRECENLSLPGMQEAAPILREAASFPPFETDIARAEAALPAWIGIQFRDPPPAVKVAHDLGPGAAAVITVFPGSPAELAGLEQGDVLLGPPGAPFAERGAVRSWAMLARLDEPSTLEVLRGDSRFEATIVPRAFPLKWPELPGPPEIGREAPVVTGRVYRGADPGLLRTQGRHLLFFWATWCAPCKAAIPELLAYSRSVKVPLIAITDEPADKLDTFLKNFAGEFPENILIDDYRKDFVAFGVSGTPTFVVIDPEGRVEHLHTGYREVDGLGIAGWTWKR